MYCKDLNINSILVVQCSCFYTRHSCDRGMCFTIYELKVLNRATRISQYLFWNGSMLQPVAVIYPEVIRELVAVVVRGGKLIYSTPSSPTTPAASIPCILLNSLGERVREGKRIIFQMYFSDNLRIFKKEQVIGEKNYWRSNLLKVILKEMMMMMMMMMMMVMMILDDNDWGCSPLNLCRSELGTFRAEKPSLLQYKSTKWWSSSSSSSLRWWQWQWCWW